MIKGSGKISGFRFPSYLCRCRTGMCIEMKKVIIWTMISLLSCILTVASSLADREVTIQVSDTEYWNGKDGWIDFSCSAPGAEQIEIYYTHTVLHDGKEITASENTLHYKGDKVNERFGYPLSGRHKYYAIAYYNDGTSKKSNEVIITSYAIGTLASPKVELPPVIKANEPFVLNIYPIDQPDAWYSFYISDSNGKMIRMKDQLVYSPDFNGIVERQKLNIGTVDQPGGSFQIPALAPGEYFLFASAYQTGWDQGNTFFHFDVISERDENMHSKDDAPEQGAIKAGDIISFGHSPQIINNHVRIEESNPMIQWIVMDVKDNKALLLSKFAVDEQPFNEEIGIVPWENCSLRLWLNSVFYNNAFSEQEKSAIIPVYYKDGDYQFEQSGQKDLIFLFSLDEIRDYLDPYYKYLYPVPARNGGLVMYAGTEEYYGQWWIRTDPDYSENPDLIKKLKIGDPNDYYGDHGTIDYANPLFEVRPAIWIDLNSSFFE